MDATHLGGMVYDERKGGKKNASSVSMHICGATPFVSQNHVYMI